MSQTEVVDHDLIKTNISAEFNDYMDYYLQLIKLDTSHRVLIVEDDPVNRHLVESAVAHFNPNIHCFTAVSGSQALTILNSVECDFVISDYYLEGDLTGLQLCEEIHKDHPGVHCLIVSTMRDSQFRKLAQFVPSPPAFQEKPLSVYTIEEHLNHVFGDDHAH